MAHCSIEGCDRTDMAPHPRGGLRAVCLGHDSCYIVCHCCDTTFIGELATVARTPVSDGERRENGPDFIGWPLCDDCTGHDLHACCFEGDDE